MSRRTFDPDLAREHALAMEAARKLTGRVCSDDEEQEASEAFMAWAQSLGLRATFMRVVSDDGRMIWLLNMDTGRGKIQGKLTDPRDWRKEVERLGLWADSLGL